MNDPSDVHELASIALFSLPADYPITHLGDGWLRVRDLHAALTTGAVDGRCVLETLHWDVCGSLLRPDLMDAAEVALGGVA